MARRRFLTALGMAPALRAVPPPPPAAPQTVEVDAAEWVTLACPVCTDRTISFLPRQRRNVCAWCGTVVRRGLG